GQRRITDAESAKAPVRALRAVIRNYAAGDTNLAWTRLTPLRATLAAALDQVHSKVTKVEVETGPGNPAADLLVAWLSSRLKVPVVTRRGEYDHISYVRMHTSAGTVSIERGAGSTATFIVPGSTDRQIPLAPRSLTDLLAEDLRRLDEDDVYKATITHLLNQLNP
ncbi:MAG: glucose-6-phosphate dehydrogenase assembly protein OpcA, partial [Propionibacteriales bacterium]|nr:glucose-6-phosphate dehydrogenase assembly protein OpcA [Propionibacteriales bacterium]